MKLDERDLLQWPQAKTKVHSTPLKSMTASSTDAEFQGYVIKQFKGDLVKVRSCNMCNVISRLPAAQFMEIPL